MVLTQSMKLGWLTGLEPAISRVTSWRFGHFSLSHSWCSWIRTSISPGNNRERCHYAHTPMKLSRSSGWTRTSNILINSQAQLPNCATEEYGELVPRSPTRIRT